MEFGMLSASSKGGSRLQGSQTRFSGSVSHPRLSKVMTQIKNLDTTSDRDIAKRLWVSKELKVKMF
ncbi:MAG: hypothetical protein IPJ39_22780 [Saprospiraceae bacterium]|nr:hypothetical protein [Saprospiraceae bacterium]